MIEELTEEKLKFLQQQANKIRKLVIEILVEAGSGHPAGSLGMADIFSAFYFHILKHDPKNPDWQDRDRLILSNGHICPALYSAMALAGYFPVEELKTLRKINSRLQGHPHRTSLPGIETTSGALGEGISQAIGIAYSGLLDKKDYHVYCITSDGEHQEGNIWEAYMWLGKNPLSNLTIIIDRNYIQIDGFTENVMPIEPLKDKLKSFGLHVLEVDGHNIRAFVDAIRSAQSEWKKTSIIIAYTIPGKGVSFMEKNFEWHGKVPDKELAKKALEEINNA